MKKITNIIRENELVAVKIGTISQAYPFYKNGATVIDYNVKQFLFENKKEPIVNELNSILNCFLILEHLGNGLFRDLISGVFFITDYTDPRFKIDKNLDEISRARNTPLSIPKIEDSFFEVTDNLKLHFAHETMPNEKK